MLLEDLRDQSILKKITGGEIAVGLGALEKFADGQLCKFHRQASGQREQSSL